MFTTSGVFSTSGGYHEYIGGISRVHRGDIMSIPGDVLMIWGDIMSIPGDVLMIWRDIMSIQGDVLMISI